MATEKRLIDVNEAIERVRYSDNYVGSSIWESGEMVEFLEGCPTVDAVEVVRGQMEEIEPCEITIDRQCCLCGTPMGREDNYCPNCGAKMDGDGDEP